MSTTYTDPNTMAPGSSAPKPAPADHTIPDPDIRTEGSRELRRNEGFAKSLDKAAEKGAADGTPRTVPPGGVTPPTDKRDKAPTDPIAKANADDKAKKAAEKPAADSKKIDLGKRSASLLKEDDDEGDAGDVSDPTGDGKKKIEGKADKLTLDAGKDAKDARDNKAADVPVTDAEIEEEMLSEKSEKSKRRFRHLHNQWKTAESKAVTTEKALKAKDEELAGLKKQMEEVSAKMAKGGEIPEDVQKKLDELQMYQRQYELENSEDVKTKFDVRIQRQEENIYTRLKTAGIKFEGKTAEQSTEIIKSHGGFRQFARAFPELVDGILDRLNVADRKDVEAAMMGQTMLEQEKQSYISGEKGKAKEYFEGKKKEAEAARANEITPEKRKEVQAKAIENLKTDLFSKMDMFKEVEIPADAPDEEKQRLGDANKFAGELRETFNAHLQPANDQEFIDTAMAATLASKFKRDNTGLKSQVKALTAELEKLRNGSKTAARNGALPASSEPKPTKPAAGFSAAIDRSLANRGSGN